MDSCATCRFARHDGPYVECRRRAPNHGHAWSRVAASDWCGEYEAVSGVALAVPAVPAVAPVTDQQDTDAARAGAEVEQAPAQELEPEG